MAKQDMEMLVRYLEENVGEPISPRELGALVPNLQDWQREFRSYAKKNGIDYIFELFRRLLVCGGFNCTEKRCVA